MPWRRPPKEHQVPVGVAHHRRYEAVFAHVRALVRSGYLGAIRKVHFHGKQDTRRRVEFPLPDRRDPLA